MRWLLLLIVVGCGGEEAKPPPSVAELREACVDAQHVLVRGERCARLCRDDLDCEGGKTCESAELAPCSDAEMAKCLESDTCLSTQCDVPEPDAGCDEYEASCCRYDAIGCAVRGDQAIAVCI